MSKKHKKSGARQEASHDGIIDDMHFEPARVACEHLESQTASLDNKAGIGIGLAGAFLVATIDLRPPNVRFFFMPNGNIWMSISFWGSTTLLALGIVAFIFLWNALKTRTYSALTHLSSEQELETEAERRAILYSGYKDVYHANHKINDIRLRWYKNGMQLLFWTFLAFLIFVAMTPDYESYANS